MLRRLPSSGDVTVHGAVGVGVVPPRTGDEHGQPHLPAADDPASYLATDRRRALAAGRELPDRVTGAVLFCDISGFTPLTEALARELGGRRGAEELTAVLGRVFDAVLSVLHRFGGDVIYFSGDAVTCWLDGDDGALAVACATRMQAAMAGVGTVVTAAGTTVTLAIKVAIAVGRARRFVVGDPDVQLLDVLAGRLMDRVADAERAARPGEIVADPSVRARLGDGLLVTETRHGVDVVAGLAVDVAPPPVPGEPPPVAPEVARRWLLPAVYERLTTGRGEFLAELRSAVPLFLGFGGIDYDGDDAARQRLDDFIVRAQRIIASYDGSTLQLTIGDKGAYLYAVFGSPVAHEDDSARACAAALELLNLDGTTAVTGLQIGVARGRVRSGSYGHRHRRTFCCLGDPVNLAARLMAAAPPGTARVTADVAEAAGGGFETHELPSVTVKGKRDPVAVRALARRRVVVSRENSPASGLFAGRAVELAALDSAAATARTGVGQVVVVNGEAGLGKSRLAAEAAARWRAAGGRVVAGEAASIATGTPYAAWQAPWSTLLGVDPAAPAAQLREQLDRVVEAAAPRALGRVPLLGVVFGATFEDTALTASFEALQRKASLEALLVTLLVVGCRDRPPLLLLIEDAHWLDPLSRDLLAVLARAVETLPVLLVVTTRPDPTLDGLAIQQLGHARRLDLDELDAAAARALVVDALSDGASSTGAPHPEVVRLVTERGQGNPYFLQEIVSYLRGAGVDPGDPAAVAALDIPESLHTLVLSRIDVLAEAPRRTAKVASVLGRTFARRVVAGAYPGLGDDAAVLAHLATLQAADIVAPDDGVAAALTWAFRHVVTRDVAYESMPAGIRTLLHGLVGQFLEVAEPDPQRIVDLLAHHYGLSALDDKKREWLLRAGIAAQAAYANAAAVDYFTRLLPLIDTDEHAEVRSDVLLRLAGVHQLRGEWRQATEVIEQVVGTTAAADHEGWGRVLLARAEIRRRLGAFDAAVTDLVAARDAFEACGDDAGVGQVLKLSGTLAVQRGDYDSAGDCYAASLEIQERLGDRHAVGALLNNLGILAEYAGDYAASEELHLRARAVREEVGDPWGLSNSHQNLGMVALLRGDPDRARGEFEAALRLGGEVGDLQTQALAHHNLGNAWRALGALDTARDHYRQALDLDRLMGDSWALAFLLDDIAALAAALDRPGEALVLAGAADAARDLLGAPRSPSQQQEHDAALAGAAAVVADPDAVRARGRSLPADTATALALTLCDQSPAHI